MAFGFDTKNASAFASGTTSSVTLTVTAGDVICVALFADTNVSLTSIKDGANNNFTVTPNSPASFVSGIGMFWLAYMISAPGGSTTITGTVGSTANLQINAICFTVSGGSAVFDKDVAKGSGTGNVATPTITPTNANSLLYGFVGTAGGTTNGGLGSWTFGQTDATTQNADEYQLSASTAQAMSMTNSGAYSSIPMAFYISSGPTGPTDAFDLCPGSNVMWKDC